MAELTDQRVIVFRALLVVTLPSRPALPPSLPPSSGYQSSWARQFWMLLLRGLKQNRRNKFALAVKVISNAFFALILGAIYSKKAG